MTLQVTCGYASGSATISNAAKGIDHVDFGFTAEELAQAERARFSAGDDSVRYTKDGTTPTDTIGHPVVQDAQPTVISGNRDVIRLDFIRITTDAVLYVELEKFS